MSPDAENESADNESADNESADNESEGASSVELFFDLVFVFALSQLSAHLLHDLTWRGTAETAVLLTAVFGVWSYTTFEATAARIHNSQTQWMLLIVMACGLFMNASIGRAFNGQPAAFIIPFLGVQIGRLIWTVATVPGKSLREHYVVVLGWFIAISPLWIAGVFAGAHTRLLWWAAAAVIDQGITWLAHPLPGKRLQSKNTDFDATHLLDRCRLLLIIALGEAVLTTGTAIAAHPYKPITALTGVLSFVAIAALWAMYFAGSDHLVNQHAEDTNDPILAARLTIGGEGIVLAGIIALAVGCELVIAHPYGATPLSTSLLLFGGSALYLLVQINHLRIVTEGLSQPRLLGLAMLLIATGSWLILPPVAVLGCLAAVLTFIAAASLRESRALL